MNKYEEMLQSADQKYNYSELEKNKIISLLECCNANDVRMTPRRMYELFFLCEDMPGMEITVCDCSEQCPRYECSKCRAADEAENLINSDGNIFDYEPSDEFYFADEVKNILNKYHGNKKGKLTNRELELILNEIKQELNAFNSCL